MPDEHALVIRALERAKAGKRLTKVERAALDDYRRRKADESREAAYAAVPAARFRALAGLSVRMAQRLALEGCPGRGRDDGAECWDLAAVLPWLRDRWLAGSRVAPTEAAPVKRARWISAKYREHLDEIVRVYVAEGHNATSAAKRVRERLGRPRFRAAYFQKWNRKPEFAALVREEEERQAVESMASPFTHGPRKIQWLVEVELTLREAYDALDPADVRRASVLSALLKVGGELREERRFLAGQQAARARASLAAALKGLLRLARRRGEPRGTLEFLETALADPASLVARPEDFIDGPSVVADLASALAAAGRERADETLDVARMTDDQLDALLARDEEGEEAA